MNNQHNPTLVPSTGKLEGCDSNGIWKKTEDEAVVSTTISRLIWQPNQDVTVNTIPVFPLSYGS